MRALLIIAVLLAALGAVGWMNRLDVLLWAAPKLIALRNPIEPNRVVDWSEGPAEAALPPNERPPNVILIVADDMGFNDVSFYNGGAADGSLQTPAIDAIAAQGVVFRNGYAANAVCAPSRASIMTGRYSTRFGFEFTPFWKIGATIFDMMSRLEPGPLPIDIDLDAADRLPAIEDQGMPASETTVAELLQDAGYYTAHIGKWHLGGAEGTLPEDQGFHDSLNMGSGTAYLPPDSPDVVNAVPGKDGIERMVWATMQYYVRFNGGDHFEPKGYLTDYYTDEALRVIEANRNRPFFLYLAHWGIHNPLQALKSDYEALAHIEDHSLRVYAAMIRALDRSVARVTAKLDELGLAENTLVIFTSDNGGAGYIGLPDINSPYRGWKLTHFEGGTHVPFFVRWPAHIAAGSTYAEAVQHIDLMPTIAAAAGATLPDDRIIDGVDVLPYVTGAKQGVPHDTLFWREGYLRTVQHRGWKLISSGRPDKRWLFDLGTDPTEQRNVADAHPQRVAELEALLAAHDAEQAEPLWSSFAESPILIDKTAAEPYAPGDEYTYWQN